jgi:transcriptional regulator with XRE-family HTH domain
MRFAARTATSLPCPCGGILVPTTLREFDASPLLGIPVLLKGHLPGLRCPNCGSVIVAGGALELASHEAVLVLLNLPRRLAGSEARFLRKAALELGQKQLASRLGLSRPTVARWETATSLAADQDFALRGLAIGELLRRARLDDSPWRREHARLLSIAETVLREARNTKAPQRIRPLRIAA